LLPFYVNVNVFVVPPTLNFTSVPSYHISPSVGDVGATPERNLIGAFDVVPAGSVTAFDKVILCAAAESAIVVALVAPTVTLK
jgi:hypothetical protein